MSNEQRDYWGLYVEAFELPMIRGAAGEVKVEDIVKAVLANGDHGAVRALTRAACEKVMRGRIHERKKRAWMVDNAEHITGLGIDAAKSFEFWFAGRVDRLTDALLPEVMDDIAREVSPGTPGDEDDENDDEEDE